MSDIFTRKCDFCSHEVQSIWEPTLDGMMLRHIAVMHTKHAATKEGRITSITCECGCHFGKVKTYMIHLEKNGGYQAHMMEALLFPGRGPDYYRRRTNPNEK